MNDRPIYYVRMYDFSVRTGVHILSRIDAGNGLYELCFMLLHFMFAHTLITLCRVCSILLTVQVHRISSAGKENYV